MASRRRVPLTPYRQAQIAAREFTGSLEREAADRIHKALGTYAEELQDALRALPDTADMATRKRQLEATLTTFNRARTKLAEGLRAAVGDNRVVSYQHVRGVWREAAEAVAEAADTPGYLMGAVQAPPVSLLGAYESLGSSASHWKTLVNGYVADAAQGADDVVRHALMSGTSPEKLARRIRPFVTGSEPFHKALGGLEGVDMGTLRRMNASAASKLEYNARRIAFSEIHNARAEAEVLSFAADPHVGAVGWRLSPSRGSLSPPDECDVFATQDLYGLGPGNYPVHAVPFPPHPFDRCERVPIARGRKSVGKPKRFPDLQVDPMDLSIPNGHRLAADRADRIRSRVASTLRQSEAANPKAALQELAALSTAEAATMVAGGLGPQHAGGSSTVEDQIDRALAKMEEALEDVPAIGDDLKLYQTSDLLEDSAIASKRKADSLRTRMQDVRASLSEADVPTNFRRMTETGYLRVEDLRWVDQSWSTKETAKAIRRMVKDGDGFWRTLDLPTTDGNLPLVVRHAGKFYVISDDLGSSAVARLLERRMVRAEVLDLDKMARRRGLAHLKTKTGQKKLGQPYLRNADGSLRPAVDPRDVRWDKDWAGTQAGARKFTEDMEVAYVGARQESLDVMEDLPGLRKVTRDPDVGAQYGGLDDTTGILPEIQIRKAVDQVWDATYRHEYGHHVDWMLGQRYGTLTNTPISAQTTSRFKRAFDSLRRQMYQNPNRWRAKHDEWKEVLRTAHERTPGWTQNDSRDVVAELSDIFESATFDMDSPIGFGHGPEYFEAWSGAKYVEPFAHLWSWWSNPAANTVVLQDGTRRTMWSIAEELFPDLTNSFLRVIRERP